MNIAIVTVYQPFANLGSFLQAYALKTFLEGHGHKVSFVKTSSHMKSAIQLVSDARPYRSYFLRIKKAINSLRDLSRLSYVDYGDPTVDCYIWGSDEIWNVNNPFFCRPVFFGSEIKDRPKIGYAVSVGHATLDDFSARAQLTNGAVDFTRIFSRDSHTRDVLKNAYNIDISLVIDPTLLIPNDNLTESIRLPRKPYLLVYTYGIDKQMIDLVRQFAAKHGLKIVSPCFWHLWTDTTIECSALQFSSLIANAEYVFTTTFHGAIFSLINHSRCCILPVRPKVTNLCETLRCQDRLVSVDCDYDTFERVITKPFPVREFESNLKYLREQSATLLLSELEKIVK